MTFMFVAYTVMAFIPVQPLFNTYHTRIGRNYMVMTFIVVAYISMVHIPV